MTLTSLLGLFIGAVAFAAGRWQYVRAQQWKRAEFTANLIKEFESRPAIRNAMVMLDWRDGEIELFPERSDPARRKGWFSDEIVRVALTPNSEKRHFSDVEAAIVDTFSEFFDALERFSHFVESGLVTSRDLHPYLRYWVETIGDNTKGRKRPEYVNAMWRYVDFYGYDIKPPTH